MKKTGFMQLAKHPSTLPYASKFSHDWPHHSATLPYVLQLSLFGTRILF